MSVVARGDAQITASHGNLPTATLRVFHNITRMIAKDYQDSWIFNDIHYKKLSHYWINAIRNY